MTDSKFSNDFLPLLQRKRRKMGFELGSQEAFKIAVKRDIQILQPRKKRTIIRQENATKIDMGIDFPEF
ncbi:hypothetical protein LCGC14_0714780 [marine sediment metagenome]|uniref:Uncharacterized protein n=1 Tax=marine sediment metagenome TaxID=412755 RepID=A0A0F9TLI5_9ZZZZ